MERQLTPEQRIEFMMYFAGLVAVGRHHPGAGTRGHNIPSLEALADEVLEMMKISEKVFAG